MKIVLNLSSIGRRSCEIGRRSCEIIMNEKTPLWHEVVCFQMPGFETSKSNSEVSKSYSWKITSFSKTTLLQMGCFSQCSTALHCSLPSTFSVLTIILSNYQTCSVPLSHHVCVYNVKKIVNIRVDIKSPNRHLVQHLMISVYMQQP